LKINQALGIIDKVVTLSGTPVQAFAWQTLKANLLAQQPTYNDYAAAMRVRKEFSEYTFNRGMCNYETWLKERLSATENTESLDAIALLTKVNEEIFANAKSSCGELRCGSYLHTQINTIVSENTPYKDTL
jgi:hypothetical protein